MQSRWYINDKNTILEFCKDSDIVVHLPEVKELKKAGLVHLKELIHYQENPDGYPIPSSADAPGISWKADVGPNKQVWGREEGPLKNIKVP